MLDAAREAVSLALGRTRGDLDKDRQLVLVLVKDVEIVGEAVTQIAEATRQSLPEKTPSTRERSLQGGRHLPPQGQPQPRTASPHRGFWRFWQISAENQRFGDDSAVSAEANDANVGALLQPKNDMPGTTGSHQVRPPKARLRIRPARAQSGTSSRPLPPNG